MSLARLIWAVAISAACAGGSVLGRDMAEEYVENKKKKKVNGKIRTVNATVEEITDGEDNE